VSSEKWGNIIRWQDTVCHPDNDGHMHVVTFRTARFEFTRSLNKIVPIPIHNVNENLLVIDNAQCSRYLFRDYRNFLPLHFNAKVSSRMHSRRRYLRYCYHSIFVLHLMNDKDRMSNSATSIVNAPRVGSDSDHMLLTLTIVVTLFHWPVTDEHIPRPTKNSYRSLHFTYSLALYLHSLTFQLLRILSARDDWNIWDTQDVVPHTRMPCDPQLSRIIVMTNTFMQCMYVQYMPSVINTALMGWRRLIDDWGQRDFIGFRRSGWNVTKCLVATGKVFDAHIYSANRQCH